MAVVEHSNQPRRLRGIRLLQDDDLAVPEPFVLVRLDDLDGRRRAIRASPSVDGAKATRIPKKAVHLIEGPRSEKTNELGHDAESRPTQRRRPAAR